MSSFPPADMPHLDEGERNRGSIGFDLCDPLRRGMQREGRDQTAVAATPQYAATLSGDELSGTAESAHTPGQAVLRRRGSNIDRAG